MRKASSQGHNGMARVGFEPRSCRSQSQCSNHSTTLPTKLLRNINKIFKIKFYKIFVKKLSNQFAAFVNFYKTLFSNLSNIVLDRVHPTQPQLNTLFVASMAIWFHLSLQENYHLCKRNYRCHCTWKMWNAQPPMNHWYNLNEKKK